VNSVVKSFNSPFLEIIFLALSSKTSGAPLQ